MALSECIIRIDKSGMELVEHGHDSFPIACYHNDLNKISVPWHWHEEFELGVVSEGKALIAIDGDQQIVEAGNGFFINSGVLHGGWSANEESCRIHSVVFHAQLVGGASESIYYQKYIHPLLSNLSLKGFFLSNNTNWHKDITSLTEKVWQECITEKDSYEITVRNLLSNIIVLIKNNCANSKATLSKTDYNHSLRIKAMLEYIDNHFSESITLKDIANSAAVSESECLRCFHKAIGTSPIKYLLSLRIKKSAEMISNTRLKISDIGLMCGFQDMSYFSKSFKIIYKITPSEYRKQNPTN